MGNSALPVIETQAGDVSAFVPTNVISITDGQIFLETNLFNSGIRPAINAGISVSRVGSAAQTNWIKGLSGGIRTDLAQYRELAAFAQFASDLDEATRKQLDRGARVTELLKQPQYSPLAVEEQVVAIFLGTKGHLDSVPVADVGRFEAEFLEHIKGAHPAVLNDIRESQKLSDEAQDTLDKLVADFKKGFATTDGSSVVPDAHVAAMDEADVEKEAVQVRKPAPKKK